MELHMSFCGASSYINHRTNLIILNKIIGDRMNPPLSPADIEDMFKMADQDGDGQVNYEGTKCHSSMHDTDSLKI